MAAVARGRPRPPAWRRALPENLTAWSFVLPASVLVLGLIIWRRDRRLWLFGAVGFCTLVISLGSGNKNTLLPWRAFSNEPLLQNIWPTRFLIATYLVMAIMLGLIEKCFPDRMAAWKPQLARMIPSYGTELADDPAVAAATIERTAKVLAINP